MPRQLGIIGWSHIEVTKKLAESCLISTKTKEQNYDFPLYLYPDETKSAIGDRYPNISSGFIADFSKRLGLEFIPEGKGDGKATFGPEDVLYYSYAIFHSTSYRERYAEFLKTDFPRLPLTSDDDLFKSLAEKGEELVQLHLMESLLLAEPAAYPRFDNEGSNEVMKVVYAKPKPASGGELATPGRVYINKEQFFDGIDSEQWEFRIGGYQVMEKWLKDRKGRKLTWDDIQHYQKIAVALKETMRLMAEIDSIIPKWPLS